MCLCWPPAARKAGRLISPPVTDTCVPGTLPTYLCPAYRLNLRPSVLGPGLTFLHLKLNPKLPGAVIFLFRSFNWKWVLTEHVQVLSLLLTNLDLQHILLNCAIIKMHFAEPGIAGIHLHISAVCISALGGNWSPQVWIPRINRYI